jgi:hypothetical protein
MTLEAEDRNDGAVAAELALHAVTKMEDTNTTSTKDPVAADRIAETPAMAAPVPRRSTRGQSLGKFRHRVKMKFDANLSHSFETRQGG